MKVAVEQRDGLAKRFARPVFDLVLWLLLAALSLFFLTGCESIPTHDVFIGKGYEPGNVFRPDAALPEQVRRVAVLPMTCEEKLAESGMELEMFTSALRTELSRTKRFELVTVTSEQLQQLTGKPAWSSADKLPPKFFELLREALGCDAVLFNRVTAFRAYPPMAIGWNFKLMDAQTARVYWALDEVFDAGDERVVNGARRFEKERRTMSAELADSRAILQSPLRFSQYSTAAALLTLPGRELPKNAKVSPKASDK